MRIAVSTDEILNEGRAGKIFAIELLSRLPVILEEHELVFHDDSPEENDWGNVEVIDRFVEANAEASLTFHAPYFEPVPCVTVLSSVEWALDTKPNFWSFLGVKDDDPLEYLRLGVHIIVPHERLRKALVDQGVKVASITNAGYGIPENTDRITPADPVTRRITKEVYGKEHSYFFAPAQGHPSDNLERLFAAYDLFRARCPEPVRLLVQLPEYGGKHSRAVRKAQKQAEHSADIVFLPRLSQHEHRNVFSSARAILYPSLSTAFPLPVLDAWTAEVPVVYTDNSILLGGGALVQGELVESIAEGMVALVTTPFLASGLVENGKRRLADFSWDRVAERVAEVLRKLS